MRLTRVYVTGPLAVGSTLTLPAAAAEHVIRVLRLAPGSALTLFDGRGGEYQAELIEADRRTARVRVQGHDAVERESPADITLLQSLARGEKMDWVVQKATELGVTRIVPLYARRSVVQLEQERSRRRLEHWQAVAIGACEQCGRNRVPEIAAPAAIAAACAAATARTRLVLAPGAATPLAEAAGGARDLALLVGPEGGFEPGELELAGREGFVAVSFGRRILRTETAAIAALTALQVLVGDLRD